MSATGTIYNYNATCLTDVAASATYAPKSSPTFTGTATAGQFNLSSTGSNLIKFDNSGVGPPTATTRSAGTKLAFYSELGSGLAEYAMGIDAYTLWNSVPSTSPFQFQWLGGSTVAATLSGTEI